MDNDHVFNISVEGISQDIHMEPGDDVMTVAQALSRDFHGTVIVRMFARARRVYNCGDLESSNPDLSKFYVDPSKEDCWAWTCYGRVTD